MKKLIIYGRKYLDLIKLVDAINEAKREWEILGFIDDDEEEINKVYMGYPVIGGREIIPKFNKDDVYFFNNVSGHWSRMQKITTILDSFGCKIPNLVHPEVDMNYVKIGRGCILPEGTIIGSNSILGDFVTLRLRVLISHDVRINNYVTIGPGSILGSQTLVEDFAFLGAGSTIMLNKVVGKRSIVGAGALVNKDVSEDSTVAGVPAKELI